jgi:hypothetical protein
MYLLCVLENRRTDTCFRREKLKELLILFQELYQEADPSGRAVCGLLVAGVTGSNPARGMDVCLLCCPV